jgi:hypothetical protein
MDPSSPGGQIALGILANILSVIVITVLALGLVSFAGLTVRRRLHRFLGGAPGWSGQVEIIVSNIQVRARGAIGVVFNQVGFVGTTITEAEYQAAEALKAKFEARPQIALFKAIASQLGLQGAKPSTHCQISISPKYVDSHRPGLEPTVLNELELDAAAQAVLDQPLTFIVLGGTLHNVLTAYILKKMESVRGFITFDVENDADGRCTLVARICGEPGIPHFTRNVGHSKSGEPLYTEYFFVQKIKNFGRSHATVFLCFGSCTAATAAAVETLADWRGLETRYSAHEFSILYHLETSDREIASGSKHRPAVFNYHQIWAREQAPLSQPTMMTS